MNATDLKPSCEHVGNADHVEHITTLEATIGVTCTIDVPALLAEFRIEYERFKPMNPHLSENEAAKQFALESLNIFVNDAALPAEQDFGSVQWHVTNPAVNIT